MTESLTIKPGFHLIDLHPPRPDVRAEVVCGLSSNPKCLSPKYFYDRRGSMLFERICRQPEYYLTRSEVGILEQNCRSIAECVGDGACLIEYGSGNSRKVRLLLDACQPAAYVPIDISRDHLTESAVRLANEYPALSVHAVCADYSQPVSFPSALAGLPRTAFFPGSSIGNFSRTDAQEFLVRVRGLVGSRGGLLIGVDTKKAPAILDAAYNDASGATRLFNLNLLAHLNNRIASDFDVEAFEHHASFSEAVGRVEMHLVSLRDQSVRIGDQTFFIAQDERVHTEDSYKYSFEEFVQMANRAGFECERRWQDAEELFMLLLLRPVCS